MTRPSHDLLGRHHAVAAAGANSRVRPPGAAGARPRFVILRLVAFGVMVVTMADSTATTLVVGVLGRDPLGAGMPLAQLSWVATVNLAAMAALLATAGRFADLLGRRGVLALGLALFGIGALTVIWAPTWPILIGGRLGQGVGAALMWPASLGLLLGELPARLRGSALGWWSACSGLGALLMQGGGGLLMLHFGWRAVFAPAAVGAVLLLVLTPALPLSRPTIRRIPELISAVALVSSVAAVVLAISQGAAWGWTSTRTLTCLGGGAALLAGAITISWRHPAAAIDLTLWRRKGFAWAGVASCLYGAASFIVLTMGPLYLLASGLDVVQMGMWLAPLSIAVVVSGRLAASAGDRMGLHWITYLGALTLGSGCVVLLTQDAPTRWSLLASLLLGVGFGTLSTATFAIGTGAADPAQYGAAAGAINTARVMGGTIGVAVAAVLIDHPVIGGAQPGFASVVTACLLLATLIAVVAWAHSLRPVQAAAPAPAVVPAADELIMLRRYFVELRTTFLQIRGDADDELTHIQRSWRPPRGADWPAGAGPSIAPHPR